MKHIIIVSLFLTLGGVAQAQSTQAVEQTNELKSYIVLDSKIEQCVLQINDWAIQETARVDQEYPANQFPEINREKKKEIAIKRLQDVRQVMNPDNRARFDEFSVSSRYYQPYTGKK